MGHPNQHTDRWDDDNGGDPCQCSGQKNASLIAHHNHQYTNSEVKDAASTLGNGTSLTSALSTSAKAIQTTAKVEHILLKKDDDNGVDDKFDFEALLYLCIRYRNGCLSLNKRRSPSLLHQGQHESASRYSHGPRQKEDQQPAAKARNTPKQQSSSQPKPQKEDECCPPPSPALQRNSLLCSAHDVWREQNVLDELHHGIQTKRPCLAPAPPKTAAPATDTAVVRKPRRTSMPSTRIHHHMNLPAVPSRSSFTTSAHQGNDTMSTRRPSTKLVGGHYALLEDGTKIRVKGTRHTFQSILQGQATLVQCPACRTMFQISASASHIYCTSCEQISPMEMALMASAANTGGGGGGQTTSSTAIDDRIACVVQRQEMVVPEPMKRAAV